jgi:hypothetical protein
MTVYYLSSGTVTAFKPGSRITVSDATARTAAQEFKSYSLIYTCLQTSTTRNGGATGFPTNPYKIGIMVSIRFPTYWNGKDLDNPDHQNQYPIPHPRIQRATQSTNFTGKRYHPNPKYFLNESLSFTCGKSTSGTFSPKKLHSGPQSSPNRNSRNSLFPSTASFRTSSLCFSYTLIP